MNGTYNYTVETYAWIVNLDKSVFKLNPILEQYGYRFIRVGLKELEKKFSELFGFPTNIKSENFCVISHFDGEIPANRKAQEVLKEFREKKLANGSPIEEIETTISNEFYNLLLYSTFDGHNMLLRQRELIFLKKINDFDHEVINNGSNYANDIKEMIELGDFVSKLIQSLRLMKNGDVMPKIQFQIASESRRMTQRYDQRFSPGGMTKISIDEKDLPFFEIAIATPLKTNKLCEFALANFNLSYEIPEIRSKYLILMTCLESLFNLGSAEIAHTISRHLSLLISDQKEDFEITYKRIKELYGYRNKIIHGSDLKEDLKKITDELQDYARKAINECLQFDMTKKELFDILNAKGFSGH